MPVSRWPVVRVLVAGVLAAVAVWAAVASPARSSTTSHLQTIYIREDAFRNYDFDSQWNSATNVDWPITMLFWNNAEVNKVKNHLAPYFSATGSTMNELLNNGNGWQWDTDKGRKQVLCIFVGDSAHYRIYAPSASDRMYNLAWGYYTLVTTHIDHNECNVIDKWSGESEKAEGKVASAARAVWGTRAVNANWAWFANPEPNHNEGDHHWENDGYATEVWVP